MLHRPLLNPINADRLTVRLGSLHADRVPKLLLKEILERRGLSKRQFAKRLGVEYNNVFRYFRKGYDPRLSTLKRWADVLGCRIQDLFQDLHN